METKQTNLNESSLIWENRNRITAMEGNIGFIKEAITDVRDGLNKFTIEMKSAIQEMHDLLDNKYVSKNELLLVTNQLDARVQAIEEKVKSLNSIRDRLVWMVMGTVITALVGLVVYNPFNI